MDSSDYPPNERRPIATRELKISQRVAGWLARRGVSANAISVAGAVVAIGAGFAFWATSIDETAVRIWWIAGAVLVQLRLGANMLDGMVAIQRDQVSPVGELYNEVPDRISDAAILIGLGYAAGGWPLLGYVAALAAVFTAYVRATAKVAGAPQDFCGPLAKPQRMFAVTVAAVYMGVSPAGWQPTVSDELPCGIPAAVLLLIAAGSLLTAARRLLRAAAHLKKAD